MKTMMKHRIKMPDGQVRTHWDRLKSSQRLQTAHAIADYAIDRGVREIGRLIERPHSYVQQHLDLYAFACTILAAAGGATAVAPTSWGRGLTRDKLRELISHYVGKQIEKGDEPDLDHVEQWENQGFTTDVSKRLAFAQMACEKAMDAGKLSAPSPEGELEIVRPWEVDCRSHFARVLAVARWLDEAKKRDLQKASTRDAAVAAHVAWMEQIERLKNYHADFDELFNEAWNS